MRLQAEKTHAKLHFKWQDESDLAERATFKARSRCLTAALAMAIAFGSETLDEPALVPVRKTPSRH
jgi:hypothetical protein